MRWLCVSIVVLLGAIAFFFSFRERARAVSPAIARDTSTSSAEPPQPAEHRAARPAPARTSAAPAPESKDEAAACAALCGASCEQVGGKLVCPSHCVRDSDCGANRSCVTVDQAGDDGVRLRRCLGSECSGPGADEECSNGGTCAQVMSAGRSIFRCFKAGALTAGQECGFIDGPKNQLCARGLVCASGICAPPICSSNGDCPKGTVCHEVGGGLGLHQCFPGCAGDSDCGDGRVCLAPATGEDDMRRCMPAAARDTCLAKGCSEGQRCYSDSSQPWDAVASCLTPCQRGGNDCPAQQACVTLDPNSSVCRPTCDPKAANGCADGYVCLNQPEGVAVCQFDWLKSNHEHFPKSKSGG